MNYLYLQVCNYYLNEHKTIIQYENYGHMFTSTKRVLGEGEVMNQPGNESE